MCVEMQSHLQPPVRRSVQFNRMNTAHQITALQYNGARAQQWRISCTIGHVWETNARRTHTHTNTRSVQHERDKTRAERRHTYHTYPQIQHLSCGSGSSVCGSSVYRAGGAFYCFVGHDRKHNCGTSATIQPQNQPNVDRERINSVSDGEPIRFSN